MGLPNVMVSALAYNPTVDVLAVGTFGRGSWVLYDVTSYSSSATKLVYGRADNDSTPSASFLTGARPLEKYGTGTLTISGTSSYSGTTSVFGGRMVVNGDIRSSSSLFVDTPATLAGTGFVPITTVAGTIAPGNSIGTLTVTGSYTQDPGSTYQAEVNAAGQTDLINVVGAPGTATINGGTVSVVAAPGNYVPRRSYTILSAVGGVTGTYSSVVTNYPFIQGALGYDADDVFLTLTPGGFARGGQTRNQQAVGAVLDQAASTASGDFADVIAALSLMGLSEAPPAFEQLSGQNYASFATMGVQSAQLFMNNFILRAGSGGNPAGNGGGRVALAEACDVACQPTGHWSAWGGGLGAVGSIAGDTNARGVDYWIGGFAAGIDHRFDPHFLAGVTVGYTAATQYVQGMSGRGTADMYQAGLYASYTPGDFYLDLLAGYARGDNRQQRQVFLPGLAPRTAWGQTTVDQFFGQVEAGYKVALGGAADAVVTPFARLQGATSQQAAFTETGADSINLAVAAQTTNSLRSVVGAQLDGPIDLGWRDRLALSFWLGWTHEYADTSRPVTAAFVGAPALPFTVLGAQAPRDGAIVGLGASTAIAEATSVYLRYDADLAGGNTAHIFSAGLRMTW